MYGSAMTRTSLASLLVVAALTSLAHADTKAVLRRRPSRVLTAKVLAGIGGVSLVTSWIVGFTASVRYKDAVNDGCIQTDERVLCDAEAHARAENARSLGNIGTGFLIGAVALEAAAGIVYFTAPREWQVVVAPVATPNGGGLSLTGRF